MVGAIGGGFVGNELASKDQTLVWVIGVRYDDGTLRHDSADVGTRIADRRPRARHVDRHRTACADATTLAYRIHNAAVEGRIEEREL